MPPLHELPRAQNETRTAALAEIKQQVLDANCSCGNATRQGTEADLQFHRSKSVRQNGPMTVQKSPSSSEPGTKTINRNAPASFDFAVSGGHRHSLSWDLRAFSDEMQRAAVVTIKFYDTSNQLLPPPYPGFSASRAFPAFRYFPCGDIYEPSIGTLVFRAPPNAARSVVGIIAWKCDFLLAFGEPTFHAIDAVDKTYPASENVKACPVNQYPKRIASRDSLLVANAGIDVQPSELYVVEGMLHSTGTLPERAAILTIVFRNAHFKEIPGPYLDFTHSPQVGYYRYLSIIEGGGAYRISELIQAPLDAAYAQLSIKSWEAPVAARGPLRVTPTSWSTFAETIDTSAYPLLGMRSLVDCAIRRGDLNSALRLCTALYTRGQRANDGIRLRLLQGLATELDPTWLPFPRTPSALKMRRDLNSVAHIFKVIYPQESSGGSVRNWSIVRAQARAGFRPLACLAVQTEDIVDGFAHPNGQREGIIEVVREGTTIVYPRFAAFRRSKVPADLMLQLEANLYISSIARHRCSLIHAASGFKGFDSALKGLAIASCLGLPFVYEVRSFHEHTWSPLSNKSASAPLTDLRIQQENRCMKAADAVVTISEAMVCELVNRGIPRSKLHLVPNSVDDHFLDPPEWADVASLRTRYGLHGKTVIGYVSNVSKREGHEVLLRAFSRVADTRPDVYCLIVGEGPERKRLEAMAAATTHFDRVIFTGEIDHSLIREYYALIDVFVIPRVADLASDYVTPMKPFEALAVGCRIIMSDRPVAKEILGSDERGLSFRTGDVSDLVLKIETVLKNPNSASVRAEMGQRWVAKHRTWARNAELYRAVYADAHAGFDARISKRDNVQRFAAVN